MAAKKRKSSRDKCSEKLARAVDGARGHGALKQPGNGGAAYRIFQPAAIGLQRHPSLRAVTGFILAGVLASASARAMAGPVSPAATPVSNEQSSSARPSSLPKGTILYVRLETPVSTTSSKLHQKVTARTVRQIFMGGKVVVPLGAQLAGEIEKLHSSGTPDDPAVMAIHFAQLEIPGEKPATVTCHLTRIENARETVLKDGTIQGVAASDLGSTYVDNALAKLAQQLPSLSGEITDFEKKQVGKPDTAISYPVGADMQVTLDSPVAVNKFFAPAAAAQVPAGALTAVRAVLAKTPQRSITQKQMPGDPVNLVVIGTEQQIRHAFQQAGWDIPAMKQTQSIAKTVQAVVQGAGYGVAPISNLYLYGRPQDLAFEKVLNTFAMRHHLRLWRAPVAAGGTPIWLGAAVHDTGFDLHPGVASHATSPEIDAERAKVGADLLATGFVAAEQLATPPHPLSHGVTGTGGAWKTDGQLLVIDFKSN
ncbi:MAG: LssY C-terminal domain-containing protein [Terriglobia bacterium]